jgi:TRAP-type C4-dicarboxylate transport system permease large subunit
MLFQNVPAHIVNFATSLGLPNWGLLLLLYFIYLVMGCFIDGITIMIITLPIVAPLITAMGMSLLWFGIAMVILVELSQLTPPVGMNLYIIRNISGGKIEDVIMGSLPFLIAMALALLIITVFPSLALYLPELIM